MNDPATAQVVIFPDRSAGRIVRCITPQIAQTCAREHIPARLRDRILTEARLQLYDTDRTEDAHANALAVLIELSPDTNRPAYVAMATQYLGHA